MKQVYSAIPLLFIASLSAQANNLQLSLDGGFLFTSLGNSEETLQVDATTTNVYDPDDKTRLGYLGGLTLAYVFKEVTDFPMDIGLGFSGYYLNMGKITGLEHPFVNGGNFDTLDYKFMAQSFAFMVEPKFIFTKYSWQPYVFGGLGFALNRLYDYSEEPTDPNGGAAPAPHVFRDENMTSFAYEVGVGVQHIIPTHPHHMFKYLISADYRYMNMGKASLEKAEGQTTSDTLEVSPVWTQALVLSITTLF